MGWASNYIAKLEAGEAVVFRPRGNSMQGRIESGQQVEVHPVRMNKELFIFPKVGEIVLCKVRGREYLHLVKAVKGGLFQIGNNKGFINGWTPINSIYGIVISIDGKLERRRPSSEQDKGK